MRVNKQMEFTGKHYETGVVKNWLQTEGIEVSEEFALGASGGIAFGYFVFEYKGHLPHIALLPRNTFDPFDRVLDNLGVKRTRMESTSSEKGELNLRRELDQGRSVIIWGDVYSASWSGLPRGGMWAMQPMLVVGYDDDGYLLVDGSKYPFCVSSDELAILRSKVKKDRFRVYVFEGMNEGSLEVGLRNGIETCTKLFLDKPPAGSAKNFGITGMRYFAKNVLDDSTALGWGRRFESGDPLKQALIGKIGQPGMWDWIETWGTGSCADRGSYAKFLVEAGDVLSRDFSSVIQKLRESEKHWGEFADICLPSESEGLMRMKEIKRERQVLRFDDPIGSNQKRNELSEEYMSLWESDSKLNELVGGIRQSLSAKIEEIADLEESAITELRGLVG